MIRYFKKMSLMDLVISDMVDNMFNNDIFA